jgi:type I restriction enzyme, S subunit
MSWQKVKLDDQIETLKGYAFKSDWYLSEGIPIVKVSNFTDDSIDTNDLDYLDKKTAAEYSKYSLDADDIIIQTVGSWPNNPKSVVGKVIKVPPKLKHSLLNQNAVKIIPQNGIDKKFLYYCLKNNTFRNYIINCAQGAANQASITLDSIRGFEFDMPPSEVQTKIASILSAYDDLIENNTRRIKILEEMAQTIYKEWFVNFRFPGYEKAKFVDSHLGKIPEGWELRTVFDSVEVFSGGTPKTSVDKYWNGKIPFYTPRDSSNEFWILNTEKLLTEEGLSNCNSKLYPKHTVFITARGTVGKMNINDEPMAINQSCYALIGKNHVSQFYVFFALLNYVAHMKQIATGGVFDTIIVDTFKVIPFLLPSDFILDEFDKNISPLLNETLLLAKKNQNLRRTSDLLLPKLMSGEIEV